MNATDVGGLVLKSIAKSYGTTRALKDVSVRFEPGEIHTILGENGSGKSTMVKILSGIASKDSGTILLDGVPITCRSPAVSHGDGIATVFQELTVLPSLTVAENVFLGDYPTRPGGAVNTPTLNRRCEELMEDLGFDLDPGISARQLTLAQLQLVEFARAFARRPRILILDEATSALDKPEAAKVIASVRRLAAKGTTVLFVSHRLDEVLEISDRVSTLVDGRIVSTRDAANISHDILLNELLGINVVGVGEFVRSTDSMLNVASNGSGPLLFECEIPATAGFREDVKLNLYRGEILGLAGLQGHGQKRVLRIIGGDLPAPGMTKSLAGQILPGNSPREAISSGIYYIPEERKSEGLISGHSISANLVLSSLQKVTHWGWVQRRLETRIAEQACIRLGVRLDNVQQPIDSLSGGNQQKVVLGRGLLCEPQLLLLDDSMRGIDVRAKNEIYRLLVEFVREGAGVILNSTEIPELTRLCSRIVVFHDNGISAELSGEDMTEAAILRAMFGQKKARAA